MYEELIEKIDKVIYDTIFDTIRDSKNAYVCICVLRKRIQELIESYRPQGMDKPNSPGWWFLVFENGKVFDCVQVVKSDLDTFEVTKNDFYVSTRDRSYNCFRWIKALDIDV